MLKFLLRVWDAYNFANDWCVEYYHFDRLLITGERTNGYLARKKIGGKWVYRFPTDKELRDQLQSEAW